MKQIVPGAFVCVLGLFLAAVTGCAAVDAVFGGGAPGDSGFLGPILRDFQSLPGPIGLGADALLALGGLWAAFRGKRWKALASDSVSLINKLRNSPEGQKFWLEVAKPKLEAAKGRKKLGEIRKVYLEIKEFLKEQENAGEI